MTVLRPTKVGGSEQWDSFIGASNVSIPHGAAVCFGTKTQGAETVTPATAQTSILGFVDGPRGYVPRGGYDSFYLNEMINIIYKRANALVVANGAAVNIDAEDYLEVAALANGAVAHGILEEAGAARGDLFTDAVVARALEGVTIGGDSYKVPASNVSIGDATATMTAGDITLLDLEEGDLILLEDLNGSLQVNKVAELTSTVITFAKPSTVALTTVDSDLITKIYQCRVEVGKF